MKIKIEEIEGKLKLISGNIKQISEILNRLVILDEYLSIEDTIKLLSKNGIGIEYLRWTEVDLNYDAVDPYEEWPDNFPD